MNASLHCHLEYHPSPEFLSGNESLDSVDRDRRDATSGRVLGLEGSSETIVVVGQVTHINSATAHGCA